MRVQSIATLALLLACEVPGSIAKSLLDSQALHRRHESLEGVVRREAHDFIDNHLDARGEVLPRNTSTGSTSTPSGIPTNLNNAAVNATVAMACTSALSNITTVSNAAGLAGCYNILFLNNQTGVFEADLRLYQISQPSGMFAGIQTTDIVPEASYPDATISTSSSKVKRNTLATRQSNNTLVQLQQYSLVGQVDKTLTLTKLSQVELMALVIPSISLYATSPTTKSMVATNMTSASIAYFVTGVFAGQSASGASAAEPSAAVLAAKAAAPFAIPGKTFGIFPTGGILTWAWSILFICTVTYGTIGRIRSKRQTKTVKQAKPKQSKAETAQDSRVEMVDIDISYQKTFGERPNYYIERLPSVKRPTNF